jgi:large-conductance mechanosensitive channel
MDVGGFDLEPATINYGKFLQATFDFLIVALCVFAMGKGDERRDEKKGRRAEATRPDADGKTADRNPRCAEKQSMTSSLRRGGQPARLDDQ